MSNWPKCTVKASVTHLLTFGPPLETPKCQLTSKASRFDAPDSDISGLLVPEKNHQMAQSDQIWFRMLHLGGHHGYNAFWTPCMDFCGFLVFQKRSICTYNGLSGAPRRAPKVHKGVTYAFPVHLGQLDHYVVFGCLEPNLVPSREAQSTI